MATYEQNERVLLSGFLSNKSAFRLVVFGTIGVAEINWLIRKMEIDRDILANIEAAEAVALASPPETNR